MEKHKITGSEALLKSLIAEGVDTIFGYPGGQAIPIYDSLYDYRDKLKHVLVRHEQGATHAAQGYARVSGKVGVTLVTSGPGATNTITGIADALMDSTPMVVIAGQVPSPLRYFLSGRPGRRLWNRHVRCHGYIRRHGRHPALYNRFPAIPSEY